VNNISVKELQTKKIYRAINVLYYLFLLALGLIGVVTINEQFFICILFMLITFLLRSSLLYIIYGIKPGYNNKIFNYLKKRYVHFNYFIYVVFGLFFCLLIENILGNTNLTLCYFFGLVAYWFYFFGKIPVDAYFNDSWKDWRKLIKCKESIISAILSPGGIIMLIYVLFLVNMAVIFSNNISLPSIWPLNKVAFKFYLTLISVNAIFFWVTVAIFIECIRKLYATSFGKKFTLAEKRRNRQYELVQFRKERRY